MGKSWEVSDVDVGRQTGGGTERRTRTQAALTATGLRSELGVNGGRRRKHKQPSSNAGKDGTPPPDNEAGSRAE